MATLTVRLLTCDGLDDGEVCDAEYGGDTDVPSFNVLRGMARARAGWVAHAGRDYCPGHAAKPRAARGWLEAADEAALDRAADRLAAFLAPAAGGAR
ncbi:MAG TPA: hypothetical protein VFH77_00445 [Streptomyces sp.]|nr:hypothetical protein [Streptomyces sp.]